MAENKLKFKYQEMFELTKGKAKFRLITKEGVKIIKAAGPAR